MASEVSLACRAFVMLHLTAQCSCCLLNCCEYLSGDMQWDAEHDSVAMLLGHDWHRYMEPQNDIRQSTFSYLQKL